MQRADSLKKPIFPVLIGPIADDQWPLEIQDKQYADFQNWTNPTAYQAALTELLAGLEKKGLLKPGPPRAVPPPEAPDPGRDDPEDQAERGIAQAVRLEGVGGFAAIEAEELRKDMDVWVKMYRAAALQRRMLVDDATRVRLALQLETYKTEWEELEKKLHGIEARRSVPSNPTTGYPQGFITELKTLLARYPPTPTQLQAGFAACRRLSVPAIRPYPTDDCHRLVDYLSALYYRHGNRLPLPLASFVAHLSQALGSLPDLCAWLDQLIDWLGQHTDIGPAELAALGEEHGPAAAEQRPYLLVEVAPQAGGRTYHIYCYWQDDRGEQQPIALYEDQALAALPQLLEQALDKIAAARPCLEFFLPKALLTDHKTLTKWEQLECPRPLPMEYPLSLRCWERLRRKGVKNTETCGYDLLKGYWKNYVDSLDRPLKQRCAEWLKLENLKNYIKCIHGKDPFIGLHFPPSSFSSSYLDELLNAGAALVLWPRQAPLNADLQTMLDESFSNHCLKELPEALRQVREEHFVMQGRLTDELSLLWDDPTRVPEQADIRLDDVPLTFPS